MYQTGVGKLEVFGRVFPGVCGALLLLCSPVGVSALAKDELVRRIPDEYESTSGHGIAMNNAGCAVNDPYSAVRANPSLIAAQKNYTVNGGYHWPVAGRDYYQVGFVDSKTANWAMGLTYTGFTDEYAYLNEHSGARADFAATDSSIVRRGQLALAQPVGTVLVGAGATYVEAHSLRGSAAYQRGDMMVRGVGLNAGVATAIASSLRLGMSVENASNEKIADYAPRTFRAGVAYSFNQSITAFLDVRQRDRVAEFEADPVDLDRMDLKAGIMREPERMMIASGSAQIQDFVRLIGSYGQSLTDDRRSLAGGVAIVSHNYSLSYTAARPYMRTLAAHQAVTLSMEMAM